MNSSNVTFGGGIVQVILNYCGKLSDKIDFEFAINEKPGSGLHEMFRDIGSNFYCLPNKKSNLLAYVKEIFKICRENNYDVIHVHGNSANMIIELGIARVVGIKKRIAHCHNSQCEHPRLHKLLNMHFKKTYTDALACSQTAGEWIFGENMYSVLNNAIDVNRYCFNEEDRKLCRSELNIQDDTFVIGHVGNINQQKNHEWLLKVFGEIVNAGINAELVLVGDGPLRKYICDQARNMGVYEKIHFLGIRDDANRWMQAMDILIFPSLFEGLPLSVIEAQAAGLWVVASEAVPIAAKLTERIFYQSLDSTVDDWKNIVIELISEKNDRQIDITDFKDYDLNFQSNKLLEIYRN
jgi:glycosyltransferase involved in cell wall biosynthesis